MRLLSILVDGLLLDLLLLLPLIAFAGRLLAKEKVSAAGMGALKVLLGLTGLLIGLAALDLSMDALDRLLSPIAAEGARARLKADMGFKPQLAFTLHLGVLFAYLVNIAWARLTKARFLFLNPIHVALGATLLTLLFARADLGRWVSAPLTGLLLGSAMAWGPFLAVWRGRLMSPGARVELGAFSTLLLVGVQELAQRLGGKATKAAKGGDPLSPLLQAGLIVAGVTFALALNAGERGAMKALGSLGPLDLIPGEARELYLLAPLFLGVLVSGALWVLFEATKLTLAEFDAAFVGFSELLPGVRPALDTLFLLPEAPKAFMIGGLMSLLGGIIGGHLFGAVGLVGAVPGTLFALSAGHIVSGGGAGVIGARAGGSRGLYLGALAHGLSLSLLVSLALTASQGLGGGKAKAFAAELGDLSLIEAVVGFVLKLFS